MNSVAVIGIGNPFRGDDAAGLQVVDGVKKAISTGIDFFEIRGDMTSIIEHLSTFQTVFLVDACQGETFEWLRIDALREGIPLEHTQTSTHGLGVSQAVEMAKNFGQLPDKLILYVIKGNYFGISHSISSSVEKIIPIVIKEILNEEEIRLCMSKA